MGRYSKKQLNEGLAEYRHHRPRRSRKTTLVDKILYQCNLFGENEAKKELILDNNDLERERGITILSKNVSVDYKGTKINIIDTPGHSDFGGEVERVLNMADGVLLLVDAFEGPMPQTRYVLSKAIALGLKPIVVVNKVDKENCRPEEVQEMVFELMFNLDATEEQLDFPTVYGSAKNGWMGPDWKTPTEDVTYLLDRSWNRFLHRNKERVPCKCRSRPSTIPIILAGSQSGGYTAE